MKSNLGFLLVLHPALALALEDEADEFRYLFVLFLVAFSAILLLSSLPRALRRGVVTPEVLRAFALSKGLTAAEVRDSPERDLFSGKARKRRGSGNLARTPPDEGTTVFRGTHGGLPFTIDEVSVSRRPGNAWQDERYLRLIVDLPEAPTGLQVYPARRWERMIGRAGLARSRTRPGTEGMLCAKFSSRPVVRAQERMFLNDERRRILEAYHAKSGGIHIDSGKLYLTFPRFAVTGPELDRLYVDAGVLAKELART